MDIKEKLPFNDHVAEYERWFEKYPNVFRTELRAIRSLLPPGNNLEGLEIGVATGRFAKALKIRHGIEPAENMREIALKRGVHAVNAFAENLPYKGLSFDFILMNFCISYFTDALAAFTEAWRVLKNGGYLIIGFLEKDRPVASRYERNRSNSLFYRQARFYTSEEVAELLNKAGFTTVEFSQTLFHQPENTITTEAVLPGYGTGSYVLARAKKAALTTKIHN